MKYYLVIRLQPHHHSRREFVRGRACLLLTLEHVDRIPAARRRRVARFLDQNHPGKAMVQIPQVYRAGQKSLKFLILKKGSKPDATLKVHLAILIEGIIHLNL